MQTSKKIKEQNIVDIGRDSKIHKGKSYFYKSYFSHITQEILEDYATIHNYLSQFEWEFELPMTETYKGNQIKKVIFDIIPLNNQSMYKASYINDKKAHVVTYPDYVHGENLHEYMSFRSEYEDDEKNICYTIKNNIIQRLSIYFPYMHIENFHLKNIMVTSVTGSTLYCTITDLGDDIINFVDNQKEMHIFHKIALGGIKKHKSDKTIVRRKDTGELL